MLTEEIKQDGFCIRTAADDMASINIKTKSNQKQKFDLIHIQFTNLTIIWDLKSNNQVRELSELPQFS